jgi:hypothetical protein
MRPGCLVSLLIRALILSDHGHLITPKAPSPNTIILGIGASTYEDGSRRGHKYVVYDKA